MEIRKDSSMLKINRICIPLGLSCNFNCKYCFRNIARRELPSELSEDMKEYLRSLSPEWCESVIMSGGEPLLYFDKIKEVLSYVPANVHKCIMSNCSLLTQEIVDYMNDNNIELHLSHDGAETEYLRGVDVLKDPVIANLVKQVKILMVFAVVTNRNTDIRANYEDTAAKLGRRDFIYKTNAVYETPTNKDLILGFDYDEFARTFEYYVHTILEYSPHYCNCTIKDSKSRSNGFNVDLHGNVIGMATLTKLGTIHNSKEELIAAQDASEPDTGYCNNSGCLYKDRCTSQRQLASPHFCKCSHIMGECYGQFD